jgi:diacylglycerol kinase (ATP)
VRPAALVFNPKAGGHRSRQLVDDVLAALKSVGYVAEARPTRGPGDATRQARQAAIEGAETIFAFGGDGTLREAAFGILGSHATLGFVPGGTANVMALTLGLPARPLEAVRALAGAERRTFDVGLCGLDAFLMQSSLGVDARSLGRLDSGFKRRFGRAAVGLSGLAAWWSYHYPELEIEADGRPLTASFAAVCNIPFYGGPWKLIPAARPDDGRLDLIVFRGSGRTATLAFARDLLRGRHLDRPDVESYTVEEVVVRSPHSLPLQLDGDARPAGAPLEIRMSPAKLRILSASR